MNSTLPSMKSTFVLNYPYVNTPMTLIQPRIQYFHKYATLAMSILWLDSHLLNRSVPFNSHSEVQLSAKVGTLNLAFGMSITYDTNAREFYVFETGTSMTNSDCEASVVLSRRNLGLTLTEERIINVTIDSKSRMSSLLTLRRASPSMKNTVFLKILDYNSCLFRFRHQVHYFSKNAALAICVPWIRYLPFFRTPEVHFDATIGSSNLAFAVETIFNTISREFRIFHAGISMAKTYCDAAIIMAHEGDFLRASYVHYFDHEKKVAAAASISRHFSGKENLLVVGGSWTMDNLTTIKARFDNHGRIGTLLQHEIKPKSNLTISIEFDARALDKRPAIGLALSLACYSTIVTSALASQLLPILEWHILAAYFAKLGDRHKEGIVMEFDFGETRTAIGGKVGTVSPVLSSQLALVNLDHVLLLQYYLSHVFP
ncbi:unnamed protein product [Dovyalis caffra]|uniref:Uncharacterized protein n=1 Tax=Dovyalis caffra TaxID=77055 RepID=A0AAV1R8F4_9ROSI|nr:unnamed protein product [Dovyalis caffra]